MCTVLSSSAVLIKTLPWKVDLVWMSVRSTSSGLLASVSGTGPYGGCEKLT